MDSFFQWMSSSTYIPTMIIYVQYHGSLSAEKRVIFFFSSAGISPPAGLGGWRYVKSRYVKRPRVCYLDGVLPDYTTSSPHHQRCATPRRGRLDTCLVPGMVSRTWRVVNG